ncbi:ABC transporter permease [Candidatus Margulisiibacteriota bacterium]
MKNKLLKNKFIKIIPKNFFYNIIVIIGFFLLWELLAYFDLINIKLLPPPHELFKEVFVKNRLEFFKIDYAQKGPQFFILNSILATLWRVIAGISIGFVLGLFTGALISYFKWLRRILLPIITICAPISPIAWIPFAMIMFGIGNKPAVFVVVIGVFFLICIATVSSITNAEPIYVNTARTLGASRIQIMIYVILPSILPSLFLILRINLFAAWMSVLAAEMVGVSEGLGAMIMVGRALFNVKIIFVAMILIGFTGYLLDHIFMFVQKHFLWWKQETKHV